MILLTRSKISLIIILIFALLLRLIVAFNFPNILWSDEIFQTLEQGHRVAFGYGIIPWEFRDGIRSWLLPGILGIVMKLTAWTGDGATGYLGGVAVFLCLLSLIPVWVGFSIAYQTRGLTAAIVTGGICAIWFEFIYFSPKSLTEVIASYPLLVAVYLGIYSKSSLSQVRMGWIGFLYGLTIVLRLHFFPAVIIGITCQYSKSNARGFRFLIIVFWIPILFSGILDTFTWSSPFQSLWKNFWMNLIEGTSNGFGISPWYQYFGWLLLNWSVSLLVIVFCWSLVFRRHLILTIMALSLIISHSFIAHKEYRFIYGALQIIIILAALGTAELILRLRFLKKFSKGEAIAAMISLGIWLTASSFLAERFDSDRSLELAHLLQKTDLTHWTKHRETLLAFEYISQQKDVCGISVAGIHWSFSGGYSYLHQNVPLYFIEDQLLKNENEFRNLSLYFNYLILYSLEVPRSGYQLIKCYDKMCIYKRPFICLSNPNYHINKTI